MLTEAHMTQGPAGGFRGWGVGARKRVSRRMVELAVAPYNRGILFGAGMMTWGCLHAFAKVNIEKILTVQMGQLRLKEGKGLTRSHSC